MFGNYFDGVEEVIYVVFLDGFVVFLVDGYVGFVGGCVVVCCYCDEWGECQQFGEY